MAEPRVIGTADSDDGQIHAVLDAQGRLRQLHLAPELLRRGTGLDSTTLADRIRDTVNAAYDDLVEKLTEHNSKEMADLTEGLERTVADVERSLDSIATDIRRRMYDDGTETPPPILRDSY
ncbi:MAG: YbaB/EbfC family nucleoid-associated protein [Actinomycetota bacterium]|nr:YbaB/EbfC family nucleoid-associated protein [Actinomycetota bacterium]